MAIAVGFWRYQSGNDLDDCLVDVSMKLLNGCAGELCNRKLMKSVMGGLTLAFCAIAAPLLWKSTPVYAQSVAADGTLSTAVNTSADGKTFTITAGDRADTNLFHSFSEFSLPAGSSAVFNNDTAVLNIISRVTGGNVSAIDGRIEA